MSPTIPFVALLHGTAVAFVAVMTRSRTRAATAAVVAAGMGPVTGHPGHAVVDGLAGAGAPCVRRNGRLPRGKNPKSVQAMPAAAARPARSRRVDGVVRGGTLAAVVKALCGGAAHRSVGASFLSA
jgi:hypothetical protein